MICARIARRASGFLLDLTNSLRAKILLSTVVLGVLVHLISSETLLERLDGLKIATLLFAVVLLPGNLLVQAFKWRFLLRGANPESSLSEALTSLIAGYPLGFVTPGRLGEAGRSLFTHSIRPPLGTKLFVVDKLSTFIITSITGALCLILMIPTLPNTAQNFAILFFTSITVWLCVSALPPHLLSKLTGLSFSRKRIIALLAYSLLFHLIYLTQFIILVSGFVNVKIATIFPPAAAVFFVKSILPFSFSDLGIREGAAVLFLGQVGIEPAIAFNSAALLFLINIGIPVLLGLPLILKSNSKRATKQFPENASKKHRLAHTG